MPANSGTIGLLFIEAGGQQWSPALVPTPNQNANTESQYRMGLSHRFFYATSKAKLADKEKTPVGCMRFICENCWTEQDHDGFCDECQLASNINVIVSDQRELLEKYASITPAASEYTANGDTVEHWKSWSSETAKPLKAWIPPSPPLRAKSWKGHNFWFIGDVHGNIAEYQKAVADIRKMDPKAITIQVGDIGIGDYDLPQMGEKDFFIAGNHDDIVACQQHPNFLGKFGYRHGVFYMGGAESKGCSFKNEELTDEELAEAVKLYETVKPEIVVTHDLPESIRESLSLSWGKPQQSRTCIALEQMWQIHNPNVWACGHFHSGRQKVIEGTSFIALAPLESHQIQLSWVTGLQTYQKASKSMTMTKTEAVGKWFKNIWRR